MSDQWYYTTAGQQVGPVAVDDLKGLVASGHIPGHELAWREGMAQWTAVSLLPELLDGRAVYPQSTGAAAGTIPLQPAGVQLAYGGYEQYSGSPLAGVEYGGFWIRFCAIFIDGIILFIPNQIIQQVMVAIIGGPVSRGNPTMIISLAVSSMFVQIILDWLYYALMESSAKQATLGKMACGLVVTDLYGQRITFGRATGRYFAKQLSGLILLMGYIMAAFDAQKRALHDHLAKTFVVKKSSIRRPY